MSCTFSLQTLNLPKPSFHHILLQLQINVEGLGQKHDTLPFRLNDEGHLISVNNRVIRHSDEQNKAVNDPDTCSRITLTFSSYVLFLQIG